MGPADVDQEGSTWSDRDETFVDPEVRLVTPPSQDDRYRPEGPLGAGGVGLVSVQFDRHIGRRVATKRLRPELARDAQVRARFLREAQVQGQLEHPAVVPVYDLGTDADGAPFFTMKSVHGVTLAQILFELEEGHPAAEQRWTRHRLLNAFAGVCLAIDYAHQRGILHRDLKPANIMLGEYGEVYVLDWGLAKIRGVSDGPLTGVSSGDGAVTHVGALLGTPGYLAPEQALDASAVDERADVYALGAILFELLALAPLHEPAPPAVMIERIQRPIETRPSVRAPARDIPPELDEVCDAALAIHPDARTASARALHDAIQRHLAGQHDLELRRDRAAQHAAAAVRAAQRALGPKLSEFEPRGYALSREVPRMWTAEMALDDRRKAMREVGRALALDPGNPRAVQTLITLLTEPPAQTPPEVEYELDRGYRRDSRWVGTLGAIVYPAVAAFLPFMAWQGVLQPAVVGTFFALLLVCGGLSLLVARAKIPPVGAIFASMLGSTLAFSMTSRFGSPIMLTPAVLAVNAAGYAVFLPRRHRPWVAITACLGFIVPLVLERTGVLAPTLLFENGRVVILPNALALTPIATTVLVTAAGVVAVLTGVLLVGAIRDRMHDAERRMYLYTWHLRELVPEEARRATDPTDPTAA